MNIGKAIRELRKKQDLSQEQLATMAGLTQAALSAIEKNGVRPNPANLKKLCEALNVSEALVYIMGLEKADVSESKQGLYDELFPIIENIATRLAVPK
jgi:transcriptional regulator with XRE-family HTH domain